MCFSLGESYYCHSPTFRSYQSGLNRFKFHLFYLLRAIFYRLFFYIPLFLQFILYFQLNSKQTESHCLKKKEKQLRRTTLMFTEWLHSSPLMLRFPLLAVFVIFRYIIVGKHAWISYKIQCFVPFLQLFCIFILSTF